MQDGCSFPLFTGLLSAAVFEVSLILNECVWEKNRVHRQNAEVDVKIRAAASVLQAVRSSTRYAPQNDPFLGSLEVDNSQDAVPEDLPHQEASRQEGEAEQANPSLDSLPNGQ